MTGSDKMEMVWALLGYISACDKGGPTADQWVGIQSRAKKELDRLSQAMVETTVRSDIDFTKIDLERIT